MLSGEMMLRAPAGPAPGSSPAVVMVRWQQAMQVMIRYKLKHDQVEQDSELLHAVYQELAATRPSGLRYATFQLGDQVSVIAFAEFDAEPGAAPHHRLPSFQHYRSTLDQRCERPPEVTVLHEVGSFGFR
jgi:quinol monooxygenase YgiN